MLQFKQYVPVYYQDAVCFSCYCLEWFAHLSCEDYIFLKAEATSLHKIQHYPEDSTVLKTLALLSQRKCHWLLTLLAK